jgi:hypothetical protein
MPTPGDLQSSRILVVEPAMAVELDLVVARDRGVGRQAFEPCHARGAVGVTASAVSVPTLTST